MDLEKIPNPASYCRLAMFSFFITRKIMRTYLSYHILEFLEDKLVDIGVHLEAMGHRFGDGLPLRILWHVKSLFDLKK